MTAQQTSLRKYIVKLSDEERERLNTLIQTGKHGARQVLKARILLKADASEAGDATPLPGPASNWSRKVSTQP